MSLAQQLRAAAAHEDWAGYLCPIMNKVLTAYLVRGVDVPPAPSEHLRTYMLVVADALDGGINTGSPTHDR